ncbi:MAG: hypothetical protein AVDCRST_MAG71-393 [uncultured Lysobacter sp.]|uniref:Regulator of ribonuclease activity B domain-containing protein n=1 Tax=uncultured Lysobacter sp. TaxID=271060 RepID=A0A6J4KHQ0_9GAMM|nr:MAG: hypothetical protein AVDCRST_MAG71-393 [uncultured Lysobacter sp.]
MKSIQRAMIPDDDNGDVLRQMLDDGDDLTQPRDIDFFHVFADEAQAAAFARQVAAREDVKIAAPEADEEGVWQVAVTTHMPALHSAITALEQELAGIAQGHGGFPDGWACMRSGEDEAGEE